MRGRTGCVARLAFVAVAGLAVACGGGGDGDDVQNDARVSSPDASSPVDAAGIDATTTVVTGIRIAPALVEFVTPLGTPTNQQLTATLEYSDGSEADGTSQVTWESTDATVFDIDAAGLLTAPGTRGGVGDATARFGGVFSARAVKVQVNETVFDGGLSSTDQAALDGGNVGAGTSPAWEYPEHETVMPTGMVPPLIQWARNGHAVFSLTLRRADVVIQVYTDNNEYQPTPAQWHALAGSANVVVQLSLYGKTSNSAAADQEHAPGRTLTVVPGNLRGLIYYSQPDTGLLKRVNPLDGTSETLFNDAPGTCRGCHSVGQTGAHVGFQYNGGGDPQGGIATTSPISTVVPNFSAKRFTFSAFNPRDDRLVGVCDNNSTACPSGSMSLWDTSASATGGLEKLSDIANATALGGAPTMPAWSPDGTTLAFVKRNDGLDWSYTSGDLVTMRYIDATSSFAAPTLFEPANVSTYTAISYPAWSPDTLAIAYAMGPDNRNSLPTNLYIRDSSAGSPVQLQRGSPDGNGTAPSFSPYATGGMYWIVFYSSRAYGHTPTGPTGTSGRQLWVMAVSGVPSAGEDTSFPAFWLPGQDVDENNIRGIWAPNACIARDATCTTTSECCTGLSCIDDGAGTDRCLADSCTWTGEACPGGSNCCAGHSCQMVLGDEPVCVRDL